MNSHQMKNLVLHAWGTKTRQNGTEILGAFGTECYWCPKIFFFFLKMYSKGLLSPSVTFIISSFPTVISFPSSLRTCQYILLLSRTWLLYLLHFARIFHTLTLNEVKPKEWRVFWWKMDGVISNTHAKCHVQYWIQGIRVYITMLVRGAFRMK